MKTVIIKIVWERTKRTIFRWIMFHGLMHLNPTMFRIICNNNLETVLSTPFPSSDNPSNSLNAL